MRRLALVCMLVLCVLGGTVRVDAAQDYGEDTASGIYDQLDFDQIQGFLDQEEGAKDLSFAGLVQEVIEGNESGFVKKAAGWALQTFCMEMQENRGTLLTILFMAVVFAVLRNFIETFHNTYISELCFLMLYVELMVLLIASFQTLNQVTAQALTHICDFMKAVLPVYCMSLTFSNGSLSAVGSYELTLLVIFFVQWILQKLLLPAVNLFVLLELMNYMVEGERFSHMLELFEGVLRGTMKVLTMAVLGMSLIRGMIAPAADRMKYTALTRTLGLIPGVGNVTGTFGEIMVSAGSVIKNGVGAAVMLLLVLVCAIPVIKVGVIAFLYKATAAVLEPMTDKRIAGCVDGMFKAAAISGKILLTAIMLFLITIAVLTMASGFTA